jgi:uncharacterized protein (TIGR01777 family)
MLRVLVSGATGLVGQALLSALDERGDTVHALSRREPEAVDTGASGAERLRYFQWNGLEPPEAALQEVDVVVHLAGEPIFGGIPTRRRMERMVASRVESTRSLIAGIAARDPNERPSRLVCASAVGFYGDRANERLDEASAPGQGFLAELCRSWEAAAEEARALGLTVVRLRFGIILSRRGGALAAMRLPFDYNLGGRLGNGRQWVPWVHLDDVIGAALLAIDGELDGPVNVVAPNPVTNRELTHEIARRLDRPGFWIVPGFVLRTVLGEIADELLGSKHVAPTALERARYRFRYPELGPALADELP